ncbi:MAG TPA: LysM peptidoglycan-binding domain-containing protein [Paludibacter sp.]|nr:LysM peptidoglycan-binding domain-containing protein [Paludibacter sp.]
MSPNESALSDSVVHYGKLFLNTPYHYGSPGTSSFDCSGFTSYVFRNFGYNLERTSIDQSRQFDPVDRTQLKTGDLVFFSGRRRSKNVGHVGIVVSAKGNGEFNFIHAAVHNGVTISSSSEAYYTKRFLKASRVIGAGPILTAFHKIISKAFKNNDPEAPKQAQARVQPQLQSPAQSPVAVKQTKKVIPAEYHRVKSGETLSSIAQKYGMTIDELKKKNNIKSNKLSLKQRIKVKDEETITETVNVPAANPTRIAANTANKAESSKTDQETKQTSASHIVKKGETLSSIAKLYNTSVAELKKINNLSSRKLHLGQELSLNPQAEPTKNVEVTKVETPQKSATHKVTSGESLFSISKLYNVSVADLKKINNLSSGKLRLGQEIKLNQQAETAKSVEVAKVETPQKGTTHKVTSGESLYSISKMYNIPVDELKKINNIPTGKIRPGQELKLNQQAEPAKSVEVARAEPKAEAPHKKAGVHKVTSGESLYSIAKKYNVSFEELKKINNITTGKLHLGQEIKLSQEDDDDKGKNIAVAKSDNKQVGRAETAENTVTYKVKKGESLITIANDNNISVEELKRINNMTNSKIRFGQELKLTQTSEKHKTASAKTKGEPKSIQHKVKSGESYYSIAKDYGCTVDNLKEWNKASGSKIKIGANVVVYPNSGKKNL